MGTKESGANFPLPCIPYSNDPEKGDPTRLKQVNVGSKMKRNPQSLIHICLANKSEQQLNKIKAICNEVKAIHKQGMK